MGIVQTDWALDILHALEAKRGKNLPRGLGLKRVVDLPMAWPDQWRALQLQVPAQAYERSAVARLSGFDVPTQA